MCPAENWTGARVCASGSPGRRRPAPFGISQKKGGQRIPPLAAFYLANCQDCYTGSSIYRRRVRPLASAVAMAAGLTPFRVDQDRRFTPPSAAPPPARVSRAVFPSVRPENELDSPEFGSPRNSRRKIRHRSQRQHAAPARGGKSITLRHRPKQESSTVSARPFFGSSIPPVDICSAPSDPRRTGAFADSTRSRTFPGETGARRILSSSFLCRTTRNRSHLTPFKFLTGHSPLWCHTPSKPPHPMRIVDPFISGTAPSPRSRLANARTP